MARILLIDDDPTLLEILAEYLSRFEHDVARAEGGAAGLELFASGEPDLVVLDVAMPVMDGWSVLQEVRARSKVPVIMLTARTGESEVLQGFSLGADDYVAKPFSFAQLEARIEAVLSRTAASRASDALGEVRSGDLHVDMRAHRVSRRGETVKLTPTEFRLLVALMEQPGKILSPDQLVRKVWGEQYAEESDYVRRYIWYLRQKIEEDPDAPRYIKNERNVGYYFVEQAVSGC